MKIIPNHSREFLGAAVVFGLLMAILEFYRVREITAALLIFGVLFGTVEIAFLILILIEETALRGMTLLGARVACVRARHSATSTPADRDAIRRSAQWNSRL